MSRHPDKTRTVYILTGNDLLTGDVVYLDKAGQLSGQLAGAVHFPDIQQAEAALSAVELAAEYLSSLYVMPANLAGDRVSAQSLKEQIRATGPTIQFLPSLAETQSAK